MEEIYNFIFFCSEFCWFFYFIFIIAYHGELITALQINENLITVYNHISIEPRIHYVRKSENCN